jgi:osmotically-inducible protein OsmY
MTSRVENVMTRNVVSLLEDAQFGLTAERPDSEIRNEIMTKLIDNEFLLDSRAFTVTVTAGVVTLRGAVDREPVGLSLLDAVRHVDGVVAVRDRLSYPPG